MQNGITSFQVNCVDTPSPQFRIKIHVGCRPRGQLHRTKKRQQQVGRMAIFAIHTSNPLTSPSIRTLPQASHKRLAPVSTTLVCRTAGEAADGRCASDVPTGLQPEVENSFSTSFGMSKAAQVNVGSPPSSGGFNTGPELAHRRIYYIIRGIPTGRSGSCNSTRDVHGRRLTPQPSPFLAESVSDNHPPDMRHPPPPNHHSSNNGNARILARGFPREEVYHSNHF